MLHPSPLPKYRGGSPIQNQIIRGVVDSMVTIFVMNDKIDAGDIIAQSPFLLRVIYQLFLIVWRELGLF